MWDTNLITDEPLTLCPVRTMQLAAQRTPELVAEIDRYVGSYYPAYRDGHLLVAGGLADQPARYVELVQMTQSFERIVQAKFDAATAAEDAE